MNDSIADMIIRLKNAGAAGKKFVLVSYSKINFAIAEVLREEGFIKSVSKKGKRVNKLIEIELSYEGNSPKIKGVERISKFSRRVYLQAPDLKRAGGSGRLILTTPQGILTDSEARKKHVGGEALFKIW
ncbi:MAG: small subunit ribosomal protein S8 [Parcubacteria group bacterium Gr01-1014_107]|nr:MAG: small subunit ribosomal protein S8 [Parcubacteria group bacterium Gr01-1014_107]